MLKITPRSLSVSDIVSFFPFIRYGDLLLLFLKENFGSSHLTYKEKSFFFCENSNHFLPNSKRIKFRQRKS